jgi:hypothetical protein
MDVVLDESFFRYLLLEISDHQVDRTRFYQQPAFNAQVIHNHNGLLEAPIEQAGAETWRQSASLIQETVVQFFRPSQSERFRKLLPS